MTVKIRLARETDVADIVKMLADDPLGTTREKHQLPLSEDYITAFDAIESDPNNELVVATIEDKLVAVLQLTFIPYLTYQGGWRALIEGVRVAADHRSQGIGRQMFEWAIERARKRNCHMVQLTTDRSRPEALGFYEKLGFVSSHYGLKLKFGDNPLQ